MNKDELILAAKTLIAKIDRLETEYDVLYPELAEPDLAEEVDKAGSAAIRTFIMSKIAKLTSTPSDNVKLLESIERQLNDAEKDYSKILRKRDKLLTSTAPSEDRNFHLMKKKFVGLVNFLKQDFSAPPTYYEKDITFKKAKDQLEQSRTTSDKLINDLTLRISGRRDKQEVALREAIPALELSYEQHVKFREAAQARLDILNETRAHYERAIERKKALLQSVAPLLNLSKESLALIHASDESLALELGKLGELRKQITSLKTIFPDSPDVFLTNGGTFESMALAATNCLAEVKGLWPTQQDLNAQLTEFIQTIKQDLSDKLEHFTVIYKDVYRKIDEAHGDKTSIKEIQAKFDSIFSESKPNDVDLIVFLHDKSLKLQEMITKFEGSKTKLFKPVSDRIQEKINITKNSIDRVVDMMSRETVQFKLSSEEEKLVSEVQKYHSSLGEVKLATDPEILNAIHEQLIIKEGDVTTLISQVNERLIMHKAVKAVLTRAEASPFNFVELAKIINTSTADGKAIFVTLNQYLRSTNVDGFVSEPAFLTELSNHLELFNATGLKAIKEFIEPKTSPEANVLKEKLAFIDICIRKDIPYEPYLGADKATVIAATLQLIEWGLDANISMPTATSKTILNNETLCNALLVLKEFKIKPTAAFVDMLSVDLDKCELIIRKVNKALAVLRGPGAEIEPIPEMVEALLENVEHNDIISEKVSRVLPILQESGIKPTWKIVQQLLRDPNKCDVIEKQKNVRDETDGIKIELHTFKALLEQVLATDDKEVMKAMLAVQKHAPAHFGPWLLFLIKESPQLREILTKEDSTVIKNLPFIIPLFKELPPRMELYRVLKPAETIESELDKEILIASMKNKMQVRLEHYGPVFDALRNANLHNCALPKMARFMTKFSNELEQYFFQQERQNDMSRFRREAIPILLTNKSFEDKHADLNTLARAHFPIRNFGQQVVADILYFISGLFTWIAGVQAARNESTLFKSAEHIALSNKFRTAIQEVNASNSEDPTPPPSTLGGGGK